MYKKNWIICYFKGELRLFNGLRLLFLQKVPGATFIQGGTFILKSRVWDFLDQYAFEMGSW